MIPATPGVRAVPARPATPARRLHEIRRARPTARARRPLLGLVRDRGPGVDAGDADVEVARALDHRIGPVPRPAAEAAPCGGRVGPLGHGRAALGAGAAGVAREVVAAR